MTRALLLLLAGGCLACDSAPTQEPSPPRGAPGATPDATPESPTPRAEPMPDRKPQTHVSGATDAALSGKSAGDAVDTMMDALIDAETAAIRIDAPFVVDTDATSVPVVGAFVRVPKAGEAFENRVAVVGVSEHGIQARPALRLPKDKGENGGPAQAVLEGSPLSFDAQARLPKVAWDRDVRLYVAYGEHVSNGVTVRHGGDAAPAPVEPSPLRLAGPPAAKTEPGGTVSLTGQATGGSQVHIVGMGGADPFVHTLQPETDGAFSVNLLGENPLPKAPGIWHLYAFSGEHVAGPVTIVLTPGKTAW